MRRNCLVTGANRGIGLEFVRQLLVRGEHVIAACRQPGKATTLNGLAGQHPGRLHVLPLDVADAKSRASLLHDLPLVLGGHSDEEPDDGAPGRLDLLVNNAGVLHSGERFGHVEAGILEDSLRTNAIGPFLLAQALAPLLRSSDQGAAAGGAVNQASIGERLDRTPGSGVDPQTSGAVIANLSSIMASIASRNEFRSPSYCSSKAAQNMLTVQLAQALAARGIVVLALHPGWVMTEMGGEHATVATEDAVSGMLRLIDAAAPAQSGSFRDWRGESLPW